ncbi:hypothetical protein EI42_06316 [Thermosporothrix hazakensis]|jgi:hypothetical protein|uniref:DNA-damage-inducible protein D n=1 Tax=Thermosporothrix hazakensis TaxID=644383 RepID=A0A326TSG7_THEHA|nr:hypothetical protein EI42_06316 [Thermosporothrix hazakensis]
MERRPENSALVNEEQPMQKAPLLPSRPEKSPFHRIRHVENGWEYWSARELQQLLGYTEWRKFEDAIGRAMISCQNSNQASSDHFVHAAKMVQLGSGSLRELRNAYCYRSGFLQPQVLPNASVSRWLCI